MSRDARAEFEIQVEEGRGILSLRPRTWFGWLRVERLELLIEQVSFPLDITRGLAQFQRSPCQLLAATLSCDDRGLQQLFEARAEALAAAGFTDLRVRLQRDGARLSSRARVGAESADFSLLARLGVVVEEGDELRLCGNAPLVFGYLRRPAPLVAHDLLSALVGASPLDHGASGTPPDAPPDAPIARALMQIGLRPLELFLTHVLPQAGWRVPAVAGICLRAVGVVDGRLTIEYGLQAPAVPLPRAVPTSAADDALARHDLAGALQLYRAQAADAAQARPATERLLAILVSREGGARDAEGMARAALQRWPDFIAGHMALASSAVARGRSVDATEHFAQVIELGAAAGDDELAARAALATARHFVYAPASAARFYERALAHRPGEPEAAEALAEIYAQSGRWQDLLRVLRSQLASAEGPKLADVHLRLGELLFNKLGDAKAAAVELERALQLDPANARAWELLARVQVALHDKRGAMSALERLGSLLERHDDALAQARTEARIATLLEELGADAEAQERYERALKRVPDDAETLERAAALHARRGDATAAMALYRRLLPLCPQGHERRRRAERELLRLAVTAGDLAQARATLAQATAPADPEALLGLAALERADGNMEAAINLLGRAAAPVGGARGAALALERARLCRQLDRDDEEAQALRLAHKLAPSAAPGITAAHVLAERAREHQQPSQEALWLDLLLTTEPRLPDWGELAHRRAALHVASGELQPARTLLEAALAAGESRELVGRLYGHILGELGDARGRAAALEALATAVSEPAEKIAVWIDAAQAFISLDDLAAARRALTHAEAIDAKAPRLRAVREAMAWQARAWDEVETQARARLAEPDGLVGAERVEQRRRLGVALERQGAIDQALAVYQGAVDEIDAAGAPLAAVWLRLAELEVRRGELQHAIEVLSAAAADVRTGQPPGERAELYRRAAELRHRRQGAPVQATELLESALRLEPGHLASLDALEAIYSELGDDERVALCLRRKLRHVTVEPSRRGDWLARLAGIEETLGRVEAAREAWSAALQIDLRLAAGWRFLAHDALRTGDASTAVRAYGHLVNSIDPRASSVERRELHLLLAALARLIERPDDQAAHLSAAAELSVGAEQARLWAELAAHYEQGRRWQELAEVLHRQAAVTDEAGRLPLELKRMRLMLDELEDPHQVLDDARAELERLPDDDQLLGLVAEAARAAGDARSRADALVDLARRTRDLRARAEQLLEAANLYRGPVGDRGRAQVLFRGLTELDLSPREQLTLAARIAEPQWSYELAARAAQRLPDGDERAGALRLAATRAAAADKPSEATALSLAALRAHLSADPSRALVDELLAALRAAATRSGQKALLADGLVAAALCSKDAQVAVGWLVEAAGLRRDSDLAGAAAALTRALELAPHDAALLGQLDPLLRALGQPRRLAEALELHLRTLRDTQRIPALMTLGQLWAAELGDPVAAQRYLAEAQSLRPPPPPPVNMGALMRAIAREVPAVRAERAGAIGALRRRIAEAPQSGPARREARVELAQLYQDGGDVSAARQELSALVAADASNVAAWQALADIEARDGNFIAATEALIQLSRLVHAPPLRADIFYRLGEIAHVHCADEERASDAYLKAIDLDPGHVPTLRRLLDHYWRVKDQQGLLEIADALDEQQALVNEATPVDARAHVYFVAALGGDHAKALRLQRGLGADAAEAIAQSVAVLAAEGADLGELIAATRFLCRPPGPSLHSVRTLLRERQAEVAERL